MGDKNVMVAEWKEEDIRTLHSFKADYMNLAFVCNLPYFFKYFHFWLIYLLKYFVFPVVLHLKAMEWSLETPASIILAI